MSDDLSPEQHIADHMAWQELGPELREFLADRRATKERWEKIRAQVIGGAILACVGGVGTLLWKIGSLAMQAMQEGRHP